MQGFRQSRYIVVADGQSLNIYGSWIIKARTIIQAAGVLCSQRTVAVGGYSWADLTLDATTRRDFFGARKATYPLLVLNGGQTNIWNGDSGLTTYNAMVTYGNAARSSGGFTRVVALTMPPNTVNTGAQNTQRLDANTRIMADASAAFDAKIDLTTDALLNDTGSAAYFDGVHWTETGGQTCADLVAPTMLSLLTAQG